MFIIRVDGMFFQKWENAPIWTLNVDEAYLFASAQDAESFVAIRNITDANASKPRDFANATVHEVNR